MTDSAFPPAPVSRIRPGETIIVSKCLKCGNEIKLAIGDMTREQVEQAVDVIDRNTGECPGGYHVEFGGWRRMWDLDRAIAEHFNPPTREELTQDGEASFTEDRH